MSQHLDSMPSRSEFNRALLKLRRGEFCTTAAQVVSALDDAVNVDGNTVISISNSNKNDIFTAASNQTTVVVYLNEENDRWNNHPYFIMQAENGMWTGRVGKQSDAWVVQEIHEFALKSDVTANSQDIQNLLKYDTSSQTSIIGLLSQVTTNGDEKHFRYQNGSGLSDYPAKMTAVGATVYPMITVKRYQQTSFYIKIDAVTNDGNPVTITGYSTGSALFWEDVVYITSFTISSDTTYIEGNSLFGRKTSGVVTINGFLKLKAAAFTTGAVQVATIPQGNRPVNPVRVPCAFAEQAYTPPTSMGYLIIDDDGGLRIYVASGETANHNAVYFSCSYMAEK